MRLIRPGLGPGAPRTRLEKRQFTPSPARTGNFPGARAIAVPLDSQ